MRQFLIAVGAVCLLTPPAGSVSIRPVKPKLSDSVVVMKTSLGIIKIELFPKKAPLTVKNFLGYVDKHFYDGTVFHRVIPQFMIQGGGLKPGLTEKPAGAPIKNEAANGLSNLRGTLVMARTSAPDSATCQFFINVKDNTSLDPDKARGSAGYCVFGKVIAGMDVVDKITSVATGNRGIHQNVPLTDVIITSVRRARK